ncbi:MAG: NAD(P)-dependent oxidoreductase [Leptospiraceae bacterium]|nr:NAD(P)-dependent oxidoreductase [Leptospiraceae bacterium]
MEIKKNPDIDTVLVTGGAGYIGSVLVRLLLGLGYRVRVLDSLRFGGESIADLLNDENFSFIKGDVRDDAALQEALSGVDAVAHLAAIVGDPACAREPEEARSINDAGSRNVYEKALSNGARRFVFASTCSNYGKMSDPNSFVTETSELRPVSLYAETKVAFEEFLMGRSSEACAPIVLRFSTVYGISPRIRFDLTVNEFTREIAMGRELKVFGEQFWRPYCHVFDLSRSVALVLGAAEKEVRGQVFNVGDTSENYQKKMIVDEILKQIPDGKVSYVEKNEDPRDYRVAFDKIQAIGFRISRRVPDGIRQMRRIVQEGFLDDPDAKKYSNI